MKPPMMFTRRSFLGSGMAVLSTVCSVPGFLSRSALAIDAPAATASGQQPPQSGTRERVLVVIELAGGNDGLNTVVPLGMPEYYKARPTLAVAERAALRIDERVGLGLHPQMRGVHEMLGRGEAAIVQAVGYPNPNRSHFTSMDIWHTADPGGGRGWGWLGRALDAAPAASGTGPVSVSIGARSPLAARGRRVAPVAFEEVEQFRWVGTDLGPDVVDAQRALAAASQAVVPGLAGADDSLVFVRRTLLDAQVASGRIAAAAARDTQTRFPRGVLGLQLEQVAKMIRAGLPTRVYYTGMSGFDTHDTQLSRHAPQLAEFSAAVAAFYRELHAIGQADRVLTLAFSEFGRRVAENGSGGTDHGTAGPVFLFGPMVRGGLIGEHPSLRDLPEGDLAHRIDFRSVYAGVLDQWLAVDSQVLGRRFAGVPLLKNPAGAAGPRAD